MADYRIDDLARAAGTTVRNVRAYQDRGLLAPPKRQGRVALYDETHLARLRLIGQLLDRGYSLGVIRELTEAWDSGRSLGAVLGLVSELQGPWSDETPTHVSRDELFAMFGAEAAAQGVLAAIAFGLVEPEGDGFRVPSPRLLAVGRELYQVGVPIDAVLEELQRLRSDMERIAGRFVELAARAVLDQHVEVLASDEVPEEVQALVTRLKPLAQVAIDAELARAMRTHAGAFLADVVRRYVGDGPKPATQMPVRRVERIDVQEG